MKASALRTSLVAIEERREAAQLLHVTPLSTEKYRLEQEHGIRVWQLDTACELRFAFSDVEYGGGLRLQSHGYGINSPVLTPAGLRRAALAIEHVEDWLKGACEALAPSGPWPGYTPRASEVE